MLPDALELPVLNRTSSSCRPRHGGFKGQHATLLTYLATYDPASEMVPR